MGGEIAAFARNSMPTVDLIGQSEHYAPRSKAIEWVEETGKTPENLKNILSIMLSNPRARIS